MQYNTLQAAQIELCSPKSLPLCLAKHHHHPLTKYHVMEAYEGVVLELHAFIISELDGGKRPSYQNVIHDSKIKELRLQNIFLP